MLKADKIPRYYQAEAFDAQEFGWWENDRCVLSLPTGAGKTFVATMLVDAGLPGRSLFLADQDELCMQPVRAFRNFADIYASAEKGKDKASLGAAVVVGSSQTLSRKKRLERFPRDHFDRIIIDEAHRGTDRDIAICDYFEKAKVCGITATPFRQNLSDLSKWYDYVSYRMTAINFIEEGFAPPEDIKTLPIEIDLQKVRTGMTPDGKDYRAEDLDSAIEPYFHEVAERVKQFAPDRFGIAYLPLIASSKKFASILREHGVTAQHVDGTLSDRDDIIEAFSRNKKGAPTFQWLCNAGVVSTGVDIPIADAFLCLRPTRSAAWYQQARGRTWRVLPGVIDHLPLREQAAERRELISKSEKPNTLIFDFLWQNDQLGVQRPGDMYAESQYGAEQIFAASKAAKDPIHALEIAKEVERQKNEAIIKALQEAAGKIHGSTHAMHVGALLQDQALTNYMPMAKWEKDQPSDAQKALLFRLGVEPSTIESKGQAGKLIDSLTWRIKSGFATLKQLQCIARRNNKMPAALRIQDIEKLTREEASELISR